MSKPAFNPNQKFEAAIEQKPSFDPNKSFQEATEEEPGLLSRAFERLDAYTGAPVRAAVGSIISGGNPASAYAAQFGAPAANAPTGKELAQRVGVSDTALSDLLPSLYDEKNNGGLWHLQKGGLLDPTASGAAGLATEIVTDPTTYLPVGELVGAASKGLGKIIGSKAERLAETATGATRVQAEKFVPGTGRRLLDEGLIKAKGGFIGTTPAGIAEKVGAKIDESGKAIGAALTALDEKGVKVTANELKGALDERVLSLKKKGPGFSQDWKALEAAKENLTESLLATGGDAVKISEAEQFKRSFRKAFKNPDELVRTGAKEAYRAIMDLVEKKAVQADEALGKTFIKEKDMYRFASPVEDAATKRSIQLQQNPLLGFNDVVTTTSGTVAGGLLGNDNRGEGAVIGGLAGLLGRRVIAPRLASTLAINANRASKVAGALGAPAAKALEQAAFIEELQRQRHKRAQ